MIRLSYVVPRLVLLGLLWLFFALAFDPLLRRGLEKAGSSATGAKVEVGALDTGFFPPRLTLKRFAAADPGAPMLNLAEFAEARFELEGRPLLERKVVIKTSALSGLRWGTARKTSGALPKAPPSRAAAKLKEWADRSKGVSFASVSSAKGAAQERLTVRQEDLQSAKLAADLEDRWPKLGDEWKKKAQGFGAEQKLREIEGLAQQLQSGDPLSRVARASELLKRVDELKRGAEEARRGLEADAAKARADLEAVRKAKAADLGALRSRLELPSLDPETLSAYLLGPETAARVTKVLRLVEAARKRMPPRGAPQEPAAARGVTIDFPKERSWPAFWLKRLALAGTADAGGPLAFSGEASDFASDAALIGRPARVELSGAEGARRAKLTALLDHTKEVARDELSFEYSGLPMAAVTAGDPASFAVTIGAAPADLSGSVVLDGPALSGTIRLRQSGVTLTPASSGADTAGRLAAKAFAGIRELEVELTLGGTLEEPSLRLRSNLGSALASGLKAAVGAEAEARLADAQAQISKLVDARVQGLQGKLDGNLGSALDSLGLGKISELQDRLKKQATGGLRLPKLFR